VYFVPKKFNDKIEALEGFLEHCGVGSGMHTIPLVDDTKQQEFISNVFQEGIHESATQIISELKSLMAQEKELSPNQWNDYKNRLDALAEKNGEYSTLIDSEMGQADAELEAVQTYLHDFLLSGLIKEK
jgi:hypothetical protein